MVELEETKVPILLTFFPNTFAAVFLRDEFLMSMYDKNHYNIVK